MTFGPAPELSWPFRSVDLILIALTLQGLRLQHNVCAQAKLSDDLDLYSFTAVDILENIVSLEQYRGKVSLVVNVASQCGYTDQHYKGLATLQELFQETNKFTVLAFPCNQFGSQEPGTHKDIYNFAYYKMGVNFPIFAKINVLEKDIPPVWTYLMEVSHQTPTWNFWKYLIDHNGHFIRAWGPHISPEQLYTYIRDAISKIDKDSANNGQDVLKDEF